jgi:P27 family predicted phage terminase small subunit
MAKRGPKPANKLKYHGGKPLRTIPAPPDWMTDEAKRIYADVAEDLRARNLLFLADVPILTNYCASLVQLAEVNAILSKKGYLIEDKNGDIRRNPAAIMQSKLIESVSKVAKLLGLSPYGRDHTRGEPQQPTDPEDPFAPYISPLAALMPKRRTDNGI